MKYIRLTGFFPLLLLLSMLILPPRYAQADEQSSRIDAIISLAKQGDAEACFALALIYEYGDSLERDPVLAARWFQQAASQGIAGASFYLGMKYENGSGVKRKHSRAIQLYRQAAMQDWAMAQYFLARLLADLDVEKNKIEAAAWVALAWEQGYPSAEALCTRLENTLTIAEKKAVEQKKSRLRTRIAEGLRHP